MSRMMLGLASWMVPGDEAEGDVEDVEDDAEDGVEDEVL